MARTVRVRLELDRNDYKAGLRDAANDTRAFDGEVRTLGDHAARTGGELKATDKAAKQLGDDAKQSARDVNGLGTSVKTVGDESVKTSQKTKSLDARIREAKASVAALGEEYLKTGDTASRIKLTSASNDLRELEKLKKAIGELTSGTAKDQGLLRKIFSLGSKTFDNSEIPNLLAKQGSLGGKAFGSGFMGALAPFAIPAAVAFGAPLVVELGAILSGATVGALGLGGIAAGLALQFNNPRVKAAVTDLGQYALTELQQATTGFADSALRGFAAMKREAAPLFVSLRSGFDALTPYLGNLLARLGQGLAKLGPGLAQGMAAAGPIVERLAADMPMLFDSIGGFFNKLSGGAKGAGEAIDMVIRGAALGITALGNALQWAANAFDAILQSADRVSGVLAKIPGLSLVWGPIHDHVHAVATSMDGMGISAAGSFGKVESGATSAADALMEVMRVSDALLNTWMSADRAAIALSTSMNSLKDSAKQNGTALEGTSAKALANRSALLDVVDAAEKVRKSDLEAGASAEFANAKYDKNIGTLRAAAIAAGFNAGQVDAMIQKYRQVPGDVSTRVDINGVDTAINRILSIKSALNSLQNKTVTTTVVQNTVTGQTSKIIRSGPAFNRWGGVYEHAATGLLREANTYSAKSPGRYMIAEQATGGEAFVPRNGSYGRSMSILSKAASWYGASVSPGGSGGTTVINRYYSVTVAPSVATSPAEQGAAVVRVVKAYEQSNGKNWRGG
jgi:hypothetical protein